MDGWMDGLGPTILLLLLFRLILLLVFPLGHTGQKLRLFQSLSVKPPRYRRNDLRLLPTVKAVTDCQKRRQRNMSVVTRHHDHRQQQLSIPARNESVGHGLEQNDADFASDSSGKRQDPLPFPALSSFRALMLLGSSGRPAENWIFASRRFRPSSVLILVKG